MCIYPCSRVKESDGYVEVVHLCESDIWLPPKTRLGLESFLLPDLQVSAEPNEIVVETGDTREKVSNRGAQFVENFNATPEEREKVTELLKKYLDI